jgi:hypothetical protein
MAAKHIEAFLYVLGVAGGPCKIGWSESAERRAKYMAGAAGSKEIAYTTAIEYRLALYAERYAHWLLRDHHFRNEWFNVEPDEAIAAVNTAKSLDFAKIGRIPPMLEHNNMAKFPKGTLARIDEVLEEGEKRSDLVREAVERELKRRARKS